MTDRLNGISVFVTAVGAGSFALAASRLHLSRSAVGKTIARLEQRLGVRLFHRTTRSLSLTDDGRCSTNAACGAGGDPHGGNAAGVGQTRSQRQAKGNDAGAVWPHLYRAAAD
ncbi:Cyn operon transcriptional activator [Serratia plymuthica]|uniref:Cyn operon transcriptional activator n=1 Tax=Serratia plymuthica TaxID=82996 RepID=A0A2X4V2H5_SERPL|nr:Cyn operon transcriptional activator [Serratia plymuthica]